MEMVCRLIVIALGKNFLLLLSFPARHKALWELCTQLVTVRPETCPSRIAGLRAPNAKTRATELLRKTWEFSGTK
jgi:hypothetical protein